MLVPNPTECKKLEDSLRSSQEVLLKFIAQLDRQDPCYKDCSTLSKGLNDLAYEMQQRGAFLSEACGLR